MRYIYITIITAITILITCINIKLYSENYTPSEKKLDIINQLNFLEYELKNNNLGDRMQQLFPEGFIFINALYGLSWCELALADTKNDSNFKEKAIQEALYAYNEINSPKAKQTFDTFSIPENGIYYFGWKNYLLSKILSVDTTLNDHLSLLDTFRVQCEIVINILKDSKTPYLSSYPGQAWPADMFVAMASLSNHDKIFFPKYGYQINEWINKVKERLDPVTKMIPHKVDPVVGNSVHGARGCSSSLILRMLSEINPVFGKQQFDIYKSNFVSTTFGLPSVLEYPKGQHGWGDIDSGPVIFGVGFAGTIVSIGTFSVFDSEYLAEKQYKTINAFGLGVTTGDQKRYLFGELPMADAFISWGRATSYKHQDSVTKDHANWRIKFHVISFVIIILFWLVFFWKKVVAIFNGR